MSFREEFQAFIAKGNVVDLAIAVVVGGAFGNIVTAFVKGFVMPLVSYILPSGTEWRTWYLGHFEVGMLLGATIDFLIIALVVFIVLVKGLGALMNRNKSGLPSEPTTKTCPRCLETVSIKASRCKFCTSDLG